MKRAPWHRRLRPPATFDRSAVLNWTERISSVTHLFASLEYLTRSRDRQRGGANNWAVNRRTFHEHAPRLTRALDLAANDRVATALHVSRAVAAAALWLPLGRRQRVAANAVLTGSQAALHAQHLYGSDGADQVSFLVQALTTAARAGQRRPAVVDACLWFVALQSVLSYTVSGWAKLPSETWRSGRALPGITRTLTYGDPQVWQLMRRYPRLTKLAAHGVLAMECAFPLAYAAKGRPAPYLLATAGAFHLVNARVMGLGRFFWAFTSTYPAVAYTTRPRERTGDAAGFRRDDTLPAVAAAAGLVLFAAGQVARVRRRRLIERGRGDERTVTTAAGNVLSYRYAGNPPPDRTTGAGARPGGAEARSAGAGVRSGGSAGDGPVVVLESGMAATAEHWERIAGPLGDRFTTVTYQRAGYGASRYRGTGEYRFETMVDDLVELTRHVAGDRPVVLVGHSLGGYLALLAAAQLGDQVHGVALVDSSHPAELRRSLRQAEGGRALTSTLAIMPGSLRAGFGSLLPRAPWIDRLPEPVRPLALAQYRDPELWAAARREWRVVQERFSDESTGLPRIDVPLVVVTAGRTARADPVQADLHDEFAAAAPRAQRHLITEADHDEILTDADRSAEVVTILTAFVDDVTEPEPEVRR
ncbi:alpha/beta fold hydrolase [Micromonospora antibiotica]|uniref:Alpha/beta fold hydrolase n=1 Tax=Micromonospora antibiotica TaxID=2807623 RepID=A0ABS3V6I7_9ACTN|nr:alpha/beta fold hydrolase [Micromonospora antibiotica]MBO4161210.1 alpha/beta fold hydrolase [Micromonospora antibiotica]